MIHVYSGSSGEIIGTITNPGGGNPDLFGFQNARAGDRDWDGVEDVWVAAPDDTFLNYDADGGLLYLMNGSDDLLLEIADPDTLVFEDSYGFGWTVAVTEDLNGDGAPELMVGEPARSVGGQAEAGVVYLVLGGFKNRPPVAHAGPDQTVPAGPDCHAVVTLDGSLSHDLDEDPLTYSWTWDSGSASGVNPMIPLSKGSYTITLTVDDGLESDTEIVVITVIDNIPPIPDMATLSPVTGECTGQIASMPTATDNCAGSIIGTTSNPLSYAEQGTYAVTWTYDDGNGNFTTQTQSVVVQDVTPPSISVSASPDTLWPPNHKLVSISTTVTATDNCDPAPLILLQSITANEGELTNTYDSTLGDGHAENDVQDAEIGSEDYSFSLRAERSGTGAGRVYTTTYSATDASGNMASASATVTVPHNQ
jgi:hypothetical protein